ncbi:hypothetical protein M6B38_157930 [Iris pallida]|uniref:Uncharacterized protein n=1 Tax=Iris pallida TaxID=29817 RepID=A0AAX6F1F9_IRIPA|nr:hypothetical protein M6B38_157930 [Iris pallida]
MSERGSLLESAALDVAVGASTDRGGPGKTVAGTRSRPAVRSPAMPAAGSMAGFVFDGSYGRGAIGSQRLTVGYGGEMWRRALVASPVRSKRRCISGLGRIDGKIEPRRRRGTLGGRWTQLASPCTADSNRHGAEGPMARSRFAVDFRVPVVVGKHGHEVRLVGRDWHDDVWTPATTMQG